jgi:hypothetical protein
MSPRLQRRQPTSFYDTVLALRAGVVAATTSLINQNIDLFVSTYLTELVLAQQATLNDMSLAPRFKTLIVGAASMLGTGNCSVVYGCLHAFVRGYLRVSLFV